VDLNDALKHYEEDPKIGAVVITGSDKAFAGESEDYAISVRLT
jgi:enoyl-CoA hydratase/carnithine racemase